MDLYFNSGKILFFSHIKFIFLVLIWTTLSHSSRLARGMWRCAGEIFKSLKWHSYLWKIASIISRQNKLYSAYFHHLWKYTNIIKPFPLKILYFSRYSCIKTVASICWSETSSFPSIDLQRIPSSSLKTDLVLRHTRHVVLKRNNNLICVFYPSFLHGDVILIFPLVSHFFW